jgi:hypothetical protein
VNWPDYVVLAEKLVAERFEASKRSAVSRAYYGTLNACRSWLESNGAPINKHRVHAEVWGIFATGGYASTQANNGWKLIADLGSELRGLRNQADYDDRFPGLDQHAAEAVGVAKQILALLPELELAD